MLASLYKKIGLKFSLNDSRWGNNPDGEKPHAQEGKRPEDGPPDLEQLWRDVNQKLNRLFGKKRGGMGGGFNPSPRGTGIGIAIFAVLALLLWLASGSFIVQEDQAGVVTTFGKFNGDIASPGFNWRWPYPIQNHEIVNNVVSGGTIEIGYRASVRNKQPQEALMLTADQNIVDIQFAIRYKITNAAQWVFANRDPEDTIRQAAESAIREAVGKHKMDFVLYDGRDQLARDVQQLIQRVIDPYKIGAQITGVTVQNAQPPEQVQAAFDEAVKAAQDRERQKNEAQAYADDIIPRARGTASRLNEEAEAYRTRVVATAEGDAARFKQVLAEYQKAPAVTRSRMYIDTMQQIFSNTTKVLTDLHNGSNLLYLPWDKLISQATAGNDSAGAKATISQPANPAGAAAAGSSASAGSASVAAPAESTASQAASHPSDARSREGRDSRDREGR